jgi:hypothetical protein
MQIKGHVHYSALLNQFDLTFWIEDQGAIVTTDLGPLNWQLYDKDGAIITDPEATGSGIAPLANGLYAIPLVSNPEFIQNYNSYLIRVEALAGDPAVTLSTFIPFIITNL